MHLSKVAARVRYILHVRAEAEIRRARIEGYRGKIWAWSTMAESRTGIHVTRVEPEWPLEDIIGDVSVYDLNVKP